MADLIITQEFLEGAAAQLKVIHDDLDQADENRAEWRHIFGHSVVDDAVFQFIDNWWVKREKLLENIEDLQTKMQTAADTWTDTETELSKAFESEDA